MKKIMILIAGLCFSFQAFAQSVEMQASDVDKLISQGFVFVIAMTKNGVDSVLVNKDILKLSFKVGDSTCQADVQAEKDSVYLGETLGVLSLRCENHGVQTRSLASCSSRFGDVLNHFEIKDSKDHYVLDLLCRKKN